VCVCVGELCITINIYANCTYLSMFIINNNYKNELRFVLDEINYSLWLTRMDTEELDLKIHLIKILFLSLQSNHAF